MKRLLLLLFLFPVLLFGQSSDLIKVTENGVEKTISASEARVITANPNGTSKVRYRNNFQEFNVAEDLNYFVDTTCNLFIDANYLGGTRILINKRHVDRIQINATQRALVTMTNGQFRYSLNQNYFVLLSQFLQSTDCGGEGGGGGLWTFNDIDGISPTTITNKVGIGTATPLSPLDVKGTDTGVVARFRNASDLATIELENTSGDGKIEVRNSVGVKTVDINSDGESLLSGGTLRLGTYGVGNNEAVDLAKTESVYVYAPATDGTVLEVHRDSFANLINLNSGFKLLTIEDLSTFDRNNILSSWNEMADSVGYVALYPGHEYWVDTTSLLFVKNDSFVVYGNGATIRSVPTIANTANILTVINTAKNVTIRDLNFKSDPIYAPIGYGGPGSPLTSNVVGIRSDTTTRLVVENCTFDGLRYGMNIKTTDEVHSNNNKFTRCLMSTFINEADIVHVNGMDSDRSFFSMLTSLNHHLYISESRIAHVNDCYFKGGGRGAIRAGNEVTMFANPMTLNVSNTTIDSCELGFTVNWIETINADNVNFKADSVGNCYSLNNVLHLNINGGSVENNNVNRKMQFIAFNTNAVKTRTVNIDGFQATGSFEQVIRDVIEFRVSNSTFYNPVTIESAATSPNAYVFGISNVTHQDSVRFFFTGNTLIQDRNMDTNQEFFDIRGGQNLISNNVFRNKTADLWSRLIYPIGPNGFTIVKDNLVEDYNFPTLELVSFGTADDLYLSSNNRNLNGGFTNDEYQIRGASNWTVTEKVVELNGGFTATLPSSFATKKGWVTTIKSQDGNPVLVVTEGAELIDNQDSIFVSNSATLLTNGTNWTVIGTGREDCPVSPYTFGAIGDGVTNDSLALQTYFDYCATNNLNINICGGGTFATTGGHIIQSSIQGDGETVLKMANNADLYFGVLRNNDEIFIDKVVFDGNRDNQSALVYTQNYSGFRSNSLFQVFEGIEQLKITNSHFYDTRHGVLCIQDKTDPGVPTVYDTTQFNNPVDTIESVIVTGNTFKNIGTQSIAVFQKVEFFERGDSNKIFRYGHFLADGNHLLNCGTVESIANTWGDDFSVANMKTAVLTNNEHLESARYATKFSSIEDIVLNNNRLLDMHWGGYQVVSNELDSLNWVYGTIRVEDNDYRMSKIRPFQTVSTFAQIRGSSGDDPVLKKDEYIHVIIENNNIQFDTAFYAQGITTDQVEITNNAKFRNVTIKNNKFENAPRAAIRYSFGYFDDYYEIETFRVQGNHNVVETATTTTNSFFYYVGSADSSNIADLFIEDNFSRGSNYSVYFEGEPAENLYLNGNNFDAFQSRVVARTGSVPSYNNVTVGNNIFYGSVDLGGDFETIAANPLWSLNIWGSQTDYSNTIGQTSPDGIIMWDNLGIGTTPISSSKLFVDGEAAQNVTAYIFNNNATAATSYALQGQMNASQNTTQVGLSGLANNATALRNVGLHGYTTGATYNIDLYIGSNTINAGGSYGIFNASTKDNYFAGKLGINDFTPDAHLDIVTAGSGLKSFLFDVEDNLADAGTITDAGKDMLKIVTTNGGEAVELGTTARLTDYIDDSKTAAALGKTTYANLKVATDGTVLVDTTSGANLLYVEDYGAKGDGITNDEDAWQNMIDALGYARGKKGANYYINPSGATGIEITADGTEIIGNGCTFTMPANPVTNKILFQIQADNAYLHDFEINSTNFGNESQCCAPHVASNWYGIQAAHTSTIHNLKIENVKMGGLYVGVRSKDVKNLDIQNVQMDSVLTGYSITTTQGFKVTDFYIDRDTFGTNQEHGFYISNCAEGEISDGEIVGGGDDGGSSPGRAININATEVPYDSTRNNIIVDNVRMDSTGGIAVWGGQRNITLSSISFHQNHPSNECLWVDSSSVVVNNMTVFNDATFSSDAIQLSNQGTALVNGITTTGETRFTPADGELIINNGYFENPSANDVANFFINTTAGQTDSSLFRMNNSIIRQLNPHVSAYIGRLGLGRNEFNNCTFDYSAAAIANGLRVQTYNERGYIDDNSTFLNVTNVRVAGADGDLYMNDFDTWTANDTTRGQRTLIASGAMDTIWLSSSNISQDNYSISIYNASSADNIIVATEGAETINGSADYPVYDVATFEMDGTNVRVRSDGPTEVRGFVNNVFVGHLAGDVTTGVNNTFIGLRAGDLNSTGGGNTFIGTDAGGQTSGNSNLSFFGFQSGEQSTGSSLTGMGWRTFRLSSGSNSVAVGANAGLDADGTNNAYIGYESGKNSTNSQNTAVGAEALENEADVADAGTNQTVIGYRAGKNTTAASDNTILIGYQAGDANSFSNVVVVGYDVDATANNQIVLGNATNSELITNNYNFDIDQTVGATEDNYILTYDDGDGQMSLENIDSLLVNATPSYGWMGFADSTFVLTLTGSGTDDPITNPTNTLFSNSIDNGYIVVAGDSITINCDCAVEIDVTFSFSGGNTSEYRFKLLKSGTKVSNIGFERHMIGSDVASGSFNYIYVATSGDVIKPSIEETAGTTDATFVSGSVSIHKL